DQQVPELGNHRPRAVGAARLRDRAGRLTRRRLVAGVPGPGLSRETDDLYQCIEWAGTQPWSNGKVGMLGISYYASNQWRVAGKHPPHLAAIIPWEGQNDRYRDSGFHGGILSQFQERWAKHQVTNIQYGMGQRAKKNPITGESVAGPVTLSDEELAKNRINVYEELKKHPLDDEWHRQRSADLGLVTTPLLTCANWGGQGIHPRGNFNGFIDAPAEQKWLEAHGDSHWSHFYSPYAVALQKLFVSSSTKDSDLFLVVRVFDPQGTEVTFMGSTDPNTPIANGWLRVSHRRLDPKRSLPYRPYHPHDRVEPLTPGEVYECDVEIVTSCIVVPAGSRRALTVRGKDYEYEGEVSEFGKKFHYGTRGTGGMTHADADDRPANLFGGMVTLYAGGGRDSYLLLPIIPPKGGV